MKKLLLLIILSATIFSSVSSQPRYPITPQEHIKYWYFRQKLITNFLVIGQEVPYACSAVIDPQNRKYGGCGFSLPAHQRYWQTDGYKKYQYSEGAVELGWYIGVLATELRLLFNHGQPYERTQYELLCALRTYARLDNICEYGAYTHNSSTRCDNMNGLFLRDDVDANLFENNKAFAAKFPDWNNPDLNNPERGLGTILIGAQEFGHCSYPSQDQIAHLFMGFALVKRCLSDIPARYYFDDLTGSQVDFVGLAQYSTELIADRLMGNVWQGYLVHDGEREPYDKCCNQWLEMNCYGLASAAYQITGKPEYLSWFTQLYPAAGAEQIEGWEMKGLYLDIGHEYMWNRWSIGNDFNIALILSYAAVADNWQILLPLPKNITYDAMVSYGNDFHLEFYALLNHYLHNKSYSEDNISELYPKLEEYIHMAKCDGNYNQPLGDVTKPGVPGWMASNRWIRPIKADDGIDKDGFIVRGDFNGLDFMLLYNLYYLVALGHGGMFDPYTFYTNLNMLDTNNDIHRSGAVYLKDQVDLASKIGPEPVTNYGDIYIRSDTEINLLPGFETENNTDIFLDIAPIEGCE